MLPTIVALALVVRTSYVLIAPQVDPILLRDPLYGDASGYHLLAINLLRGLGLTWDGQTPTSFRMPGYPAFLALVYWLFQPGAEAVRLIQAVLGALTCIPVFLLARRIGGEGVAVWAGVGVALHPVLVYMTGWLYSETLFLLLLWTGLWQLARAFDKELLQHALLAGLLLGLATLVRPEVVAVLPIVLAAAWLLHWPRRLLRLLLAAHVVLAITILPWTIRNIMVHQSFVVLTTNTGAVFYGGNNDRADGGYYLDTPFVLTGFTEVGSDKEYMRRAQDWIEGHPTAFLALLPAKFMKTLSPMEMVNSEAAPVGTSQFDGLLNRLRLPVKVVYGGFLLLALVGTIVSWRQAPRTVTLLLILFAWYVLTALVFYGGTRISLPLAPGLVLLAAIGLAHIYRRVLVTNHHSPSLREEWSR